MEAFEIELIRLMRSKFLVMGSGEAVRVQHLPAA
jgi:hypothetical protein